MSARVHALDSGCPGRLVRIDAAELDELRADAKRAADAYAAGFADGRERLADELGVSLPPRVRTARDRALAEHAAVEENVIRLIYARGREDAAAELLGPRGHGGPRPRLRAADSTPGGVA